MNQTSARLDEITNQIHFSEWFTPLNLEEQRTLFLENNSQDPQFVYSRFPKEQLSNWLQELEGIWIPQSTHDADKDRYVHFKIEETILTLQLLLARGTSRISEFSSKLYQCYFSEGLLRQAQKDAQISEKFIQREDNRLMKLFLESISTFKGMELLIGW